MLDIIQKEIVRLHRELDKPCGWRDSAHVKERGRKMRSSISPFMMLSRATDGEHRATRSSSAGRRDCKPVSDAKRCDGERECSRL